MEITLYFTNICTKAGHINDFVKLFDAIPKLSDVAFEK